SYIGPDANLRNPHVAAWFGVVVVLWVLGTNWLVIRDGAEQLVRHPGLLNYRNVSARSIKVWWLLGLGGGVLALVMLFARTGGRPGKIAT
ncbi:MAG TPA: hypothetical protein VLC48_03460, partial [Gemmatimonadota bacterium]|nr:hypothetical protein [Gemmatimonadota bacterium]